MVSALVVEVGTKTISDGSTLCQFDARYLTRITSFLLTKILQLSHYFCHLFFRHMDFVKITQLNNRAKLNPSPPQIRGLSFEPDATVPWRMSWKPYFSSH